MNLWFRLRRTPQPVASEASQSGDNDPQRGTAAVAGSATTQSRMQRQFAWVVAGALGVALLTWYYQRLAARGPAQAGTTTRPPADSALPALDFKGLRRSQAEATKAPSGKPEEAASPYLIGSVLGDSGISPTTEFPETARQTIPGTPAAPPSTPTPEQRRLTGEVFIRPTTSSIAAEPAPTSGEEPTPDIAGRPSPSALAQALTTSTPATAIATRLPDRRLRLPRGRLVDCTLLTAIDSSLPGLATCLTASDTFSEDGTVVLLDRGSTLIGEVQSNVAQGQGRVFVLWTEARTPTGVIVPLASPGTDALGRSGLPGKIDRHFWDRFGAAMLVSVIDGAVQGYAARQTNGGTVVVNPSGTQDVMTEVLRSTVSIPPTIRIEQGSRIQILAARDVDFRGVYQLTSR